MNKTKIIHFLVRLAKHIFFGVQQNFSHQLMCQEMEKVEITVLEGCSEKAELAWGHLTCPPRVSAGHWWAHRHTTVGGRRVPGKPGF